MKCTKAEKWISDLADGCLPLKKRKLVESHLEECASCRVYKGRLEVLRQKVRNLGLPEVSADYFQDFSSRLKVRLSKAGKEEKRASLPKWKWAYAASGLMAAAFILSLFVVLGRKQAPAEEFLILSFEEAMGQVLTEIGGDSELKEMFNTVVLASIEEIVEESSQREGVGFVDPLLIWGSLPEEELKILELEIKKKNESLGGRG